MKYSMPGLVLLLFFCTGAMGNPEVTPKDILSEKYARELFPEKFEYTQHIEKYKQALVKKENVYKKLDTLASLETLPLWPLEEQKKYKHIISLVKNDQSNDAYEYIRELGVDYAVTLNKVVNLNDIYTLERNLIRANKEIAQAEEWAARVANIVQYFYEDFIKGALKEDIYFYVHVLLIEKELKRVQRIYSNNADSFILANEKSVRGFYLRWKRVKQYVKSSPERETLFMQLEQKFLD